ncbi:MAG TPA: hypothetical protein VN920_04485 [Pyrinomonadaceae bacterium]|nr:hypothetical protein [Pyrinomonadaceae bacterium]
MRVLFSDLEVVRYLGVEAGKIFSREECERVLDTSIEGWQRHGFGLWAIIVKRLEKFAPTTICLLIVVSRVPR